MIKDSQELGAFLGAESRRLGAWLAFDTHYDAQNWVVWPWHGKVLHRLDFQPLDLERKEVAVTVYEDHFKFLPRFFRWAHRAIPMFPYVADIKSRRLATLRFPLEERQVAELVGTSIGAQPGAPGDGSHAARSARS